MTDDTEMITGGARIARELGLTTKQLYNSMHAGGLKFIWKEPGLGLTTTRTAARDYLASKQKSAANSEASSRVDSAA